jgi:uncharacterized protein (TIGR02145 family)
MNMKKTIQLIPLCAALFWACSDSQDITGTTIIDNTMGQNESSSSEMQSPESSSNTMISGENSSSSEQTPKISSSSQQPPVSSSSVTTSSASQEASPAFVKDTKNGFKLGACISPGIKPLGVATRLAQTTDFAEVTFGDSPKAYILNDGEGHYQVMALNINDYCDVDAELSTVRSGDTLEIKYGVINNVTECTCNSDHWFDIEPEDTDIKFVRFGGSFSEVTYEISSGPVPEPSKVTQTDTTSTQTSAQNDSTFTDTRDGKTYRIVKLGEQIWMAENLNYEMDDGVKSWCNGNKQENCDKYGRLYTYKSATYACPPGWRLPEVEEWPERGNGGHPAFLNYAVVGWYGGKDTYGFSILPAGNYSAKSQYFFEPGGGTTYFWTMTIDTRNNNCATMIHFGSGSEGMVSVCASDENDGLSVRCVKD